MKLPKGLNSFSTLLSFAALESDEVELRLNGRPLRVSVRDASWKDAQIFSPRPQPPSGGKGRYTIDPGQRLVWMDFSVPARQCRADRNQVQLRVLQRGSYPVNSRIVVGKLEMHVVYT